MPLPVIDIMDDMMGQTALHKAALHRKRTVCRLLVRKGASLCRTDLEVSEIESIQAYANLCVGELPSSD